MNRLLKRNQQKTVVSTLSSTQEKRSEFTRLTVTVTNGDIEDLNEFVQMANNSEELSQRTTKSSVIRAALRNLYKEKKPISKLV